MPINEKYKLNITKTFYGCYSLKNKYYLVRRKGIMMPAPVATNNKTTWSTVSRTLMSLTTRALAFELSNPSSVTYCCC